VDGATVTDIGATLTAWKASLATVIPVAGLLSRNEVAYKWKAPFRAWMLREAVAWRLTDLLSQSFALHEQGHGLGARILLRSAFESLATLIYLNQIIRAVVDGKLPFNEFGEKTSVLLLGSRNNDDMPRAISILTVLEKCEKRYPGMMELYADLSESAHPNYEGLIAGYSKIDRDEYETHFSDRWMELHGNSHLRAMELCMSVFEHEYNKRWPQLVTELEQWLVENDAALEAAKDASSA